MGRGRDKIIRGSDIPNMSPGERVALGKMISGNDSRSPKARINGSALVIDGKSGNAKYSTGAKKGTFGEDSYG